MSRRVSRRRFLAGSAAASAALLVPGAFDAALASIAEGARRRAPGFGPLVKDPAGLLDLPAGFRYRALSAGGLLKKDGPAPRFADRLDNGDPVPALHDGMAAFPGPDGITILVRNHELDPGDAPAVRAPKDRTYDPLGTGGTTTLWVDRERKLVRSFVSLAGTFRNCAGGATPWGSWLTAEECTYMPGPVDARNHDRRPEVTKPHGYLFEVDAYAEGPVEPVPIRAMGRFYREAIAVDPVTGYVYMTEDHSDGLLYRFRPDAVDRGRKTPGQLAVGDLARGGVVEALRVPHRPGLRTQNWGEQGERVKRREEFPVEWVPIPDVEPEMDERVLPASELAPAGKDGDRPTPIRRGPGTRFDWTRQRWVEPAPKSMRGQGFALGCTQFARAEGICYHRGAVYMCCTNGGAARAGQVWKLDLRRGHLSLAVEAAERSVMDGPDNLCPAPWGDLLVCEDGRDADRVLGLTAGGAVYDLARNVLNDQEMAGACFSPDGETLFVNMQEPGVTYAIWGPWERRDSGP